MSRLSSMRGKGKAEEPEEKAAPSRTRSSPRAGGEKRLVHSGDDIFERAKREEAKQAEARKLRESGLGRVFRFWVPEGESREIIILDADIREGRQFFEHNLKIDGQWGNHKMCVQEVAPCPVCAKFPDFKPYFIVVLTVLDLTPFKIKKGTKDEKEIPWSRKLLALKSGSLAAFKEIQDAVLEEHKTLRGTYLVMNRPKNAGQNVANIGTPKLLKGGKVFDYLTEKELVEEFGSAEVKDKQSGKVIRAKNIDITPFDYDLLFPEPTEEDIENMRESFGLGALAGSRKEAIDAWDEKEEETGGAREEEEQEAPARSGRGRRAAAEEEPAGRGRRQRATEEEEAPARGGRGRRRAGL